MPIPFLSLAAAAAAADAYFNVCPVGIVGIGAGFMPSAGFPVILFGKLDCSADNTGIEFFNCTLGRLGAALSDIDCDLPLGPGAGFVDSPSGGSSCTLCPS
jgi:hypothetical protein